jgi:serine phosphatase RsbU (regulator of sigma subunit)
MDANVRHGRSLVAGALAPVAARRSPLRAWSKLSIRTRLILVATVPQLVYTNVMTWLGNQTLHQALARMDAHLIAFPALRVALHEIYSDGRLLLYVTISVGVGLVSAAGASVMANQLRKKLDHLREAAGLIARGNLDLPVGVRGSGEIGQIGEALDDVRQKLRSRIDLEVANTHLHQDLTLARAVESMFLPRHNEVECGATALAAFHRAAPRCSGDIWHSHCDGQRVTWVMLGDVAGTGPGPAMIAAALVTAYRIRVERAELNDPHAVLRGLHETVLSTAKGQHPAAISLLSLTQDGTLSWWSAGMPSLLVRRSDRAIAVLSSASRPLGIDELCVTEQHDKLAARELVLAFTSGVGDVLQTSLSQLHELLASTHERDVAVTRDELAQAIEHDLQKNHREDVTLIVLGRRSEERA